MLTARRLAAAAVAAALGLPVAAPAAAASPVPGSSGRQLVTELRRAWQITKGHGVTVAVLSDGVDPTATGLAGKVRVGPDYVKLRDPRFLDGTLIASGIAGDGPAAANPLGTLGLAPDARILSVRYIPDRDEPGSDNFNDNVFTPDTEARAIRYAVQHGAGVIFIDEPPRLAGTVALDAAARYAIAKGVVITTLAIRDNAGDVTYPAGIPGVIAAAMEPLPAPLRPQEGAAETLARNASVLVTVPDNTLSESGPQPGPYMMWSTDSAAAWLAGTVALIKSAYPRLAPALVARALALSARDHPKGGYDISTGFGIINPYGALTEAAKLARAPAVQSAGIEPPARFGPAPPAINAVHRSAACVAAFGAVAAAGVIALAVALILALRRPRRPLAP